MQRTAGKADRHRNWVLQCQCVRLYPGRVRVANDALRDALAGGPGGLRVRALVDEGVDDHTAAEDAAEANHLIGLVHGGAAGCVHDEVAEVAPVPAARAGQPVVAEAPRVARRGEVPARGSAVGGGRVAVRVDVPALPRVRRQPRERCSDVHAAPPPPPRRPEHHPPAGVVPRRRPEVAHQRRLPETEMSSVRVRTRE